MSADELTPSELQAAAQRAAEQAASSWGQFGGQDWDVTAVIDDTYVGTATTSSPALSNTELAERVKTAVGHTAPNREFYELLNFPAAIAIQLSHRLAERSPDEAEHLRSTARDCKTIKSEYEQVWNRASEGVPQQSYDISHGVLPDASSTIGEFIGAASQAAGPAAVNDMVNELAERHKDWIELGQAGHDPATCAAMATALANVAGSLANAARPLHEAMVALGNEHDVLVPAPPAEIPLKLADTVNAMRNLTPPKDDPAQAHAAALGPRLVKAQDPWPGSKGTKPATVSRKTTHPWEFEG